MPHNVIPLTAKDRDDLRLATQRQSGYRLAESDRLAILAQAPSAQAAREIERMRLQFVEQHGDAFGLSTEEVHIQVAQETL